MNELTASTFPETLYQLPDRPWVVLDMPWQELTAEDRTLLQKILSAVGLSIEGVTLRQQPAFDLASLGFAPSRLLYFGKAAAGLPLNEAVSVGNTSVIIAPPLRQLQGDADAKKKLWQALKQLFNG
jgi:DNA polymerase III psi subunit